MLEVVSHQSKGFALPSVLIASVVLLSVLVTAVSATVAIRGTLREQHFTELAKLAGEAGTVYAKNCLEQNNDVVTWSDDDPLRPNTDCEGEDIPGLSPYVLEQDDFRTYFVVKEPVAGNISGEGYLEALRSSTGIAWRVWGSSASAAQSSGTSLPVGTSLEGYWTTAPSGYLLEDGSCVSQATYAALYAVIGSTFGTSGCSAGNFRLPDSRGRVAVNQSSDTEFDALGEKNGAKTHTLTTAQMPSHTHTGTTASAGEHRHNLKRFSGDTDDFLGGSANPYGLDSGWSTGGTQYTSIMSPEGAHTHTFTTASTGSGSAHNNIQPSIVVLRVIKY